MGSAWPNTAATRYTKKYQVLQATNRQYKLDTIPLQSVKVWCQLAQEKIVHYVFGFFFFVVVVVKE